MFVAHFGDHFHGAFLFLCSFFILFSYGVQGLALDGKPFLRVQREA